MDNTESKLQRDRDDKMESGPKQCSVESADVSRTDPEEQATHDINASYLVSFPFYN